MKIVETLYGRLTWDGILERNDMSPVLVVWVVLAVILVMFQLVMAPIGIVMHLLATGVPLDLWLSTLNTHAIEDQFPALITGNTVGQWFGIGLIVLLASRLHSSQVLQVIGFGRGPTSQDIRRLVPYSLLWLSLLPVVEVTTWINSLMPIPDSIRAIEDAQLQLLSGLNSGVIPFGLLIFATAVTPAWCEEVLFRGYLMQMFSRRYRGWTVIIASGILFGLYHVRVTQLIPLSILGCFFAWVAWRERSLWMAVWLHFLNNLSALFAFQFWPDIFSPGQPSTAPEAYTWFLALACVVLATVVIHSFPVNAHDSE